MASMSQKAKKDYLKSPYHCPYCNGTDLDDGERVHWDEPVTAEIKCATCNKRWRDVLEVSDIEEIED